MFGRKEKVSMANTDRSTFSELTNLGNKISNVIDSINSNNDNETVMKMLDSIEHDIINKVPSVNSEVMDKLNELGTKLTALDPVEEESYVEDDEFKANIRNPIPNSNNSKNVIILLEHDEAENSIEFVETVIEDKLLKNVVSFKDVFDRDDIVNGGFADLDASRKDVFQYHNEYVLDKLYERGFRCFITTFGSGTTQDLFDWIDGKDDVIFFGVQSTVGSEEFMEDAPDRLIRTSISDNYMIQKLFNDILPNFKSLLMQGGYESAELFNDNELGVNPFKKIVYIYEPSTYTLNYGNELKIMTEKKGLEYESYELEEYPSNPTPYYIRNYDVSLKNGDIIQALTSHNVDNEEYKDSDDKPLIIFNSERGSDMFVSLDKEEYYNNFTMFGDTFTDMKTRFPFIQGFMPVGNFSQLGYRISNKLFDDLYMNPQLLSIYSLCLEMTPVYLSLVDNGVFDAEEFVNKMYFYEWLKNESWAEKYLTIFKPTFKETGAVIPEKPADISDERWELYFGVNRYEIDENDLIVMKHEVNPVQLVSVVEKSKLIPKAEDDNQFDYDENISRLGSLLGEIDDILDGEVNYYNDEDDRERFLEFLDEDHKDPMLPEEFTLYKVNKTLTEIESLDNDLLLDTVTLDLSISKKDYEEAQENGEFKIIVKIPEMKYDVDEIFYDSGNKVLVNKLRKDFKEETYGEQEITITSLSQESFVVVYKGHVVRMGTYLEDLDDFDVQKTIRTFVKIPLKINWLVIYHEFKIGDKVLVIPNSRSGVVVEVADNKWEIKVEYDDDDGDDLENDAGEENFDGPDEPEEEEPAIEGDAYNIGLSIEVDENGYAKVNQSQVQLKEEVGDLYDPSEVTIGVNRKLKFDL